LGKRELPKKRLRMLLLKKNSLPWRKIKTRKKIRSKLSNQTI